MKVFTLASLATSFASPAFGVTLDFLNSRRLRTLAREAGHEGDLDLGGSKYAPLRDLEAAEKLGLQHEPPFCVNSRLCAEHRVATCEIITPVACFVSHDILGWYGADPNTFQNTKWRKGICPSKHGIVLHHDHSKQCDARTVGSFANKSRK